MKTLLGCSSEEEDGDTSRLICHHHGWTLHRRKEVEATDSSHYGTTRNEHTSTLPRRSYAIIETISVVTR